MLYAYKTRKKIIRKQEIHVKKLRQRLQQLASEIFNAGAY